ncbi:MAG: hypothetical protein KF823_11015 [Xanthomonadales bacterium]|nr:hypothetical protein [Xanthomonadales bacterium]
MDASPQPTMHIVVRLAAGFLLVAGVAALLLAVNAVIKADAVVAVLTGIALAINGLALSLLGFSPAIFGRPPRHWSVLILAFAVSAALEIAKRLI